MKYRPITINLAEKIEIADIPEWDCFVAEISTVFKLSEKETETLYTSNTAKIIATIPFAAGCNEPERTAIAHLCIYEAEIKGFQKYFSHVPSYDNDVFTRLRCIATFEGGERSIIEHGMNILAYIMVEGYNHSKVQDLEKELYNPIANGKWDYKQIKKRLLAKIKEINCPEIDQYFMPSLAKWDL